MSFPIIPGRNAEHDKRNASPSKNRNYPAKKVRIILDIANSLHFKFINTMKS